MTNEQTLLLETITKLLENTKKKGVKNLSTTYLSDRLSTLQKYIEQVSTKHAEILTLYDEETKEELPYFKEECWKKIQGGIEKAETYLTEQLNEIAMVRETSQLNVGSPTSHSSFV